MKSSFFYGDERHYETVAMSIKEHINSVPGFLSERTVHSTRATGDAIEKLVADKLQSFLKEWCTEYTVDFARRSMEDIAFKDKENFYCAVDVKSHREDTKFNMPNLTSVERISRFYKEDKNIFALMMVKYILEKNRVKVTSVTFCPIEFLDWNCLTIGALGWGQIQIANSNYISVNHGYSRKKWMRTFCKRCLEFYPKEIFKIKERIGRFQEVQAFWEQKQDNWA